jgi:hypothetical protein
LEVGDVEVIGFERGLFLFPFLGLGVGQFLEQPLRALGAAETFQVLPLSVFFLNTVLVSKDGRQRDAKTARFRRVEIQGIEGCEEYAVVHGTPRRCAYIAQSRRTMP